MARRYRGKGGRITQKRTSRRNLLLRGANHMRVPRAFPTTSLSGSFIGQQTVDLTGAVKLDESLFQLFAIRNSPDLTDSTIWANNHASGTGIPFPAQPYRNISMWSTFYQFAQITGMSVHMHFTKFTSVPPTFRAYVWSSVPATGTAVAANDLTDPVVTVVGTTDNADDDFKVIANTDVTIAALEQSRRVTKFNSYSSNAVGRTDLDISFFLPFTYARRGLRVPQNRWRSVAPHHGQDDPMTVAVAAVTSNRYGFRNQMNVAVISTSADDSTALSAQSFGNMTITTKIHVKFLDRALITPA